MSRIIAFTGKMGVGKSTAIDALKAIAPGRAVNIKFAQPLYDMQEFIYGRISSVVQRPASFVKDRKLLQWLGTDWGRGTISMSLWVDLWKAEASKYDLLDKAIVTCDDLRFDNEAEAVKSLGGRIILIESAKNAARIDTTVGLKNHASEAGIDRKYVDVVVQNDGTLEEFSFRMKQIYAEFGV